MCTTVVYRKNGSYFGRNLDLDQGFGEQVVITPRRYRFPLRVEGAFQTHFAMIGMASIAGTYPLYAEAANEEGLAAAGLNFPGLAVYRDPAEGARGETYRITPYELIPWLLGQASSVDEAEALLRRAALVDLPFAEGMPCAPLHFFIADRKRSIAVEPEADGLQIYSDPFDVLTNNPPLPYHLWNIRNYRTLRPFSGKAAFAEGAGSALDPYAEGMDAIGLPGDLSSSSRFVRAAFTLANSVCGGGTDECVSQTFHVLDAVAMTRGTVRTRAGGLDITRYSCVADLSDGTFYYKTYENSGITKVPLTERARSAERLTVYPLRNALQYTLEEE